MSAASGVRPGRLLVLGLIVVLAVGLWAVLRDSGPDLGVADPGGTTLRTLTETRDQIVAAVQQPPTTTFEGPATLDSCEGRSGTKGWTSIRAVARWTTGTGADELINELLAWLTSNGWGVSDPSVPTASRRLPNGVDARAVVRPIRGHDVEVFFEGEPRGRAVSGC